MPKKSIISVMLYLKEINAEDAAKEYDFFKGFPKDENGFLNPYFNVGFYDFYNDIPHRIANGKGLELQEWEVPCSYYFLWDDDEIVGQFKIRHCLNASLRFIGGHIGFGIAKDKRNRGYGKAGLKLAIEELQKMEDFRDDEILMSCYQDNTASLKVQLDNGAYIHHVSSNIVQTRIKVAKK